MRYSNRKRRIILKKMVKMTGFKPGNRIKRAITLLFFLFSLLYVFGSGVQDTFLPEDALVWDEFRERLDADPDYRRLELKVKSSEMLVDQYAAFYIPYISLNAGPGQGFSYNRNFVSEDVEAHQYKSKTDMNFSLSADFLHVLGTDFGIRIPVQYSATEYFGDQDSEGGEFNINYVGFTANRKLITEEHAKELENQANRLADLYNLNQTRWGIFLELAKDCFDTVYFTRLKSLTDHQAEVFERLYNNETDDSVRKNYKRQLLMARQTSKTAEKKLMTIGVGSEKDRERLYEEFITLIPKLYKAYGLEHVALENLYIRSLRLELEKAREEEDFWFLPLIANPEFSFELDYYVKDVDETISGQTIALYEKGDFSFSMGVKATLPITDRGERELEVLNRKNNADIARLQLEDAIEQRRERLEGYGIDIELAELELELKELELSEARDDSEEAEKLYKKGFNTKEDRDLAHIAREKAKVDYLNALHQYFMTELTILKESGLILGGNLDEEEN